MVTYRPTPREDSASARSPQRGRLYHEGWIAECKRPWENVGSYDFDTDAWERIGSRTDEKEPHCNHSPAMF